jgi:hypothetical protein
MRMFHQRKRIFFPITVANFGIEIVAKNMQIGRLPLSALRKEINMCM